MNVRIATLPVGEDPDSFGLKNGKKAIVQLIKDAITLVGFYAVKLSKTDAPAQADEMLKDLHRIIGSISDLIYQLMNLENDCKACGTKQRIVSSHFGNMECSDGTKNSSCRISWIFTVSL